MLRCGLCTTIRQILLLLRRFSVVPNGIRLLCIRHLAQTCRSTFSPTGTGFLHVPSYYDVLWNRAFSCKFPYRFWPMRISSSLLFSVNSLETPSFARGCRILPFLAKSLCWYQLQAHGRSFAL